MEEKIEQILRANKLRKTQARVSLVQLLMESDHAIGQQDILNKFPDWDRVTIYRNLKAFVEKGLCHEVNHENGTTLYSVCVSSCNQHEHYDNHVHFECKSCENVFCLEDVEIPEINLPKNFLLNDKKFLAIGVCNNCSLRNGQN